MKKCEALRRINNRFRKPIEWSKGIKQEYGKVKHSLRSLVYFKLELPRVMLGIRKENQFRLLVTVPSLKKISIHLQYANEVTQQTVLHITLQS